MNHAVGVDIVHVKRFERWCSFSELRLRKIFSQEELDGCRITSNDQKLYRSEGLAVRFAAKEAFFKAWCSSIVNESSLDAPPPFFTVCKLISVSVGRWGVPYLSVQWERLTAVSGVSLDMIANKHAALSLAHEREIAIATVYLQLGLL